MVLKGMKFSMINLCSYDKTITESEFKAKIDSMFMMLCISIMTDNLKRVSHLIHDSLLNKYEIMINKLNAKNHRQMYDLLTIEDTQIENTNEVNGKTVITVKLLIKYLDYVVNKKTKSIVCGNNKERIEKIVYLTLEQNNIKENNSYLAGISNIKDFNWKLIDLKTI